jgi:hypothetical protein
VIFIGIDVGVFPDSGFRAFSLPVLTKQSNSSWLFR